MAGYAPSDAGSAAIYSGVVPRPDDFDPVIRARRQAEVEITEQPASKALRFRYECEGRSAGSIPGANSTSDNKTFPSVKVVNYQGPAVVVVSCVTKDPPYRPHPHNLVGKDGCKKGVCTVNLNVETMSVTFQNLGIQCVKKKDVEESLRLRESIRVDPFQTGFDHRLQPTTIDLNTVRLCFQVFVEGRERGKYVVPLKPVVSDAIYDKKSMCDLIIYKMSDCSASVAGGKDIILLCDKVTKDDIEVRFFEVRDNRLHWEAFGEFLPADVHKQVAISFKTPRYATLELEAPVRAQIQLRRPSDRQYSEARPFTFTPLDSDGIEEKKRKMARNSGRLQRYLTDNLATDGPSGGAAAAAQSFDPAGARPKIKAATKRMKQIKHEPMDAPGGEPQYPPTNGTAAAALGGGGGLVSPTSMSGGGIVSQPAPYGVQQTQYIKLGASPTAGGDFIKAEYLYPATTSPAGAQYQGYRSPQHPAATPPPPPPGAVSPAPTQHQLLDMDTQRPVSSAANIQLDLAQLNSADLNLLNFPSDLDANVQAIEGHLSSNLSQNLSFLEEAEPPPPPPPAAVPVSMPDDEAQDAQMDSFTRNTINELEFLNQLSKR
ncbi:proto-oncogene c-Rel-like isoform X2 [Pollicipes pollicipes]|nr:proto-oncogene c-Rel-like isoform X2 [Pollicipes pollicipes]